MEELRGGGFVRLLRARTPPFQLTGLVASPDGLYEGSFVVACARWWNHEVEERPEMRLAGHRAFTTEEVRQLCEVVQPENRRMFEAIASAVSLPGRHSAAVLSLAYAFALVVEAGRVQQQLDAAEVTASWTQAPPFTGQHWTELERHYSAEGAASEYAQWTPFWIAAPTAFDDRVGPKLIASAQATFDDQVNRWSAAEGFDLRRSIGAPDYSLTASYDNARLPNFVELLFEWGGRLRLGEWFLAAGSDLTDQRFHHDKYDIIDHLYDEALQRYIEIASQPDPVGAEIEFAVRCCASWLGKGKPDREPPAISTTAVRGYLWRTVERAPIDGLEPELSQAIKNSRSVGDDRGPDERFGLTLYYAASQCMAEEVKTRLGSLGGWLQGPKSYEKAFYDTTDDFEEQGIELDEDTKRAAFQFGVCLADAERVLTRSKVGD